MRLLQSQLGRIFDSYYPFVLGQVVRKTVQHRGLSAASASADQDVQAPPHRDSHELSHSRSQGPQLDHVVNVNSVTTEATDAQSGSVEGQRRDNRVDAGAVGQSRINHR